jgi:hypothetical protein
MPTSVSLTTTYAGAVAGEYLSAAFLSNESLQHITVKTQVPNRIKIRRIQDNGTTFTEPTCTFDPGGTVTFDERTLTLVDLSYPRELCKLTFLADWEALAAQNGNINSVSEALVMTMMGKIAQINETMLWTGTATASSYAGLITQIDADNTVNFVASPLAIVNGSTATTNANILVALRNLIDRCPLAIKSAAEAPIIYMSYNCWEAYLTAQIAAGNGWYATAGPEVPKLYMGRFQIAVCPGMPANTMIMAQKSNLWFGTNELSDWNNIQVIDMESVNLDKTVRFNATFFAGTNYGFGNEIAAYGPGLS